MTRHVAILLAAFLSACANGVGTLPVLPSGGALPYVLGPGDKLHVAVYGEPDLSAAYPIDSGGTIAVPLVGLVPAKDLTVDQLQRNLVSRLDATAVRSPNVTVQIEEYRPFYILGEVQRPGAYSYAPGMSAVKAITIAGGFTLRANRTEMSVTRVTDGKPVEYRATRDAAIWPGDVVLVLERHF